MAFPRRLLHPDEEVAVDVRPHWWFYAKPAAVLMASIVLGIFTISLDDGSTRTWLTWTSLVLIVLSMWWLIVRYVRWATTRFVVTNERVVFRSGVLARSGIEIPLHDVSAVHFGQSIFERVVGAGEIVIDLPGDSGPQRFTDIGKPRRVQRAIRVQREEYDRRRRDPDVAEQLERFEGMLRRGTLTPEEFEVQKDRLLGR